WKSLMIEYGEYFPKGEVPTFTQMLGENQTDFQTKTVFKAIMSFFFHEIIINGKLLGSIIILTILSMLLQTIQSAFEHPNVSKIAYTIVYIVLIVIAVQSFQIAITYAKDAISGMM